jgi:hypothetical protein
MAETAAHLVDHVIPRVPVRQWVLSFPIPLRLLFATHPELLAPVLQIVHRVIATFLIQQAGLQCTEAHTGAVTLMRAIRGTPPAGVLRTSHFAPGKMVIQRFGSATDKIARSDFEQP